MFSLAQSDTSKAAEFPSIELKNQYVTAEFKDLRCQRSYYKFQEARTKADSSKNAEELDATRWAFFSRWAKTHLPNLKFPPLRPVDDIA